MLFQNARAQFNVAGFTADPNPNVTAPADANTYVLKERTYSPEEGRYGSDDAMGAILVVAFGTVTNPPLTFDDTIAGASLSFVLWVQDSTTLEWYRFNGTTADTAVHRVAKATGDLRGGSKIFVQVLALTGASAASFVNIKVRET